MPLLLHPGTGAVDLAVAGTIRQDISDFLAASIVAENNILGFTQVGAEFADSVCRWVEDRLNSDTVTENSGGSITNNQTTLQVSNADGAVLDVGYIIADIAATAGNYAAGEQIKITAKNVGASNTTLTVTRGFSGSLASTHASGAQFAVVAKPTYENSSLGPDMSRARTPHYNYLTRQEMNVNLSSEAIIKSRQGYVPGVSDELEYQWYQRLQELLRSLNRAMIASLPDVGSGTAGQAAGDYSTMAGIRAFLSGVWNPTSQTVTTYNFSTNGLAAGQVDVAINSVNKTLFRNGARADWAVGGANVAEDVGRLYSDRIRLQQDAQTRGFAANFFRTSLGNELRMMVDAYMPDTAPAADIFILDSGRLKIRPLADSLLFVLKAPTLNDGDPIRALCKLSLEMRNTGSDSGQAHMLISSVTP